MATINVKGYPALTQYVTDESAIQESINMLEGGPIILAACATDRGREDMYLCNDVNQFIAEHGPINFKKYGQVQKQIEKNLAAGGRVLFKRIVAPAATLANIVVVATVTNDEIGDKVTIKYTIETIPNAKTIADVETGITALSVTVDGAPKSYPIFAIAEVGRGASVKRIKIKPDYDGSEALAYMQYAMEIETELATKIVKFGLDPDRFDVINRGIRSRGNASGIIKVANTDRYLKGFLQDTAAEMKVTDINIYDLLCGKDKEGEVDEHIALDATSISLSPEFGLAMASGNAGEFEGDVYVPEVAAFETGLTAFYTGTTTPEIWNTTKYKIALVFGANFSKPVNQAIVDLVKWREDATFIKDFGLNLRTLEEIDAAVKADGVDTPYVVNYPISYDIIDPNSGVQETVTANYDLASGLVRRLINGPHVPFAGARNGAVLESAIEGTLNFEPIDTPHIQQKKAMKKLRANYASFIDGILTVETLWTSQKAYTQLSFSNNVFELQDIMRDTVKVALTNRYSFTNPSDLDNYKKDINDNIISKHTGRLKKLEFKYASDTILENQKVYYGVYTIIPWNFNQEEAFEYLIKNDEAN
jgi:hypothetical protein